MMGGGKLSIYDTFFDITVSLCDRFSGLDPIKVRKYPAHEVILLMKRTVKHSKQKKKPVRTMRPAKDNWF